MAIITYSPKTISGEKHITDKLKKKFDLKSEAKKKVSPHEEGIIKGETALSGLL